MTEFTQFCMIFLLTILLLQPSQKDTSLVKRGRKGWRKVIYDFFSRLASAVLCYMKYTIGLEATGVEDVLDVVCKIYCFINKLPLIVIMILITVRASQHWIWLLSLLYFICRPKVNILYRFLVISVTCFLSYFSGQAYYPLLLSLGVPGVKMPSRNFLHFQLMTLTLIFNLTITGAGVKPYLVIFSSLISIMSPVHLRSDDCRYLTRIQFVISLLRQGLQSFTTVIICHSWLNGSYALSNWACIAVMLASLILAMFNIKKEFNFTLIFFFQMLSLNTENGLFYFSEAVGILTKATIYWTKDLSFVVRSRNGYHLRVIISTLLHLLAFLSYESWVIGYGWYTAWAAVVSVEIMGTYKFDRAFCISIHLMQSFLILWGIFDQSQYKTNIIITLLTVMANSKYKDLMYTLLDRPSENKVLISMCFLRCYVYPFNIILVQQNFKLFGYNEKVVEIIGVLLDLVIILIELYLVKDNDADDKELMSAYYNPNFNLVQIKEVFPSQFICTPSNEITDMVQWRRGKANRLPSKGLAYMGHFYKRAEIPFNTLDMEPGDIYIQTSGVSDNLKFDLDNLKVLFENVPKESSVEEKIRMIGINGDSKRRDSLRARKWVDVSQRNFYTMRKLVGAEDDSFKVTKVRLRMTRELIEKCGISKNDDVGIVHTQRNIKWLTDGKLTYGQRVAENYEDYVKAPMVKKSYQRFTLITKEEEERKKLVLSIIGDEVRSRKKYANNYYYVINNKMAIHNLKKEIPLLTKKVYSRPIDLHNDMITENKMKGTLSMRMEIDTLYNMPPAKNIDELAFYAYRYDRVREFIDKDFLPKNRYMDEIQEALSFRDKIDTVYKLEKDWNYNRFVPLSGDWKVVNKKRLTIWVPATNKAFDQSDRILGPNPVRRMKVQDSIKGMIYSEMIRYVYNKRENSGGRKPIDIYKTPLKLKYRIRMDIKKAYKNNQNIIEENTEYELSKFQGYYSGKYSWQ